MPGGLDHIVHAVRDLDAAAEIYGRLGFSVGARNRHPWGTHNRIVQMPGFFIELLTVAEPELIPPPRAGMFSFGAFTREFLAGQEGFSMLVLESADGAADAAGFRRAGIGAFEPFRFEREGRRPDGSTVKLGFTLAFAQDPKAPRASFFACQQHYPENFWNPAFQAHANSANGVAGAVLVAENPSDHHIFLSAFTGIRGLQATSTGIAAQTARGAIQVMEPSAYRLHFGVESPDVADGARLAALRLAVRDRFALVNALRAGGIAHDERLGRIVIGPETARGATLVLEAP